MPKTSAPPGRKRDWCRTTVSRLSVKGLARWDGWMYNLNMNITAPRVAVRYWLAALFALAFLLVFLAVYPLVWQPETDWRYTFQPAALNLVAGKSPYEVIYYQNPPWLLVPLLPLSLLPPTIGSIAISLLAFCAFAFTAYRRGASPLALSLFILSPPVLATIKYAQMDWVVALGLLFPPAVGLFFVLVKPQIGIAIAFFWAIEAYRAGGLKQLTKTFLPVTLAFALSFILYGLWPLKWSIAPASAWDFFPLGVPIGIVLLFSAIREKKSGKAVLASQFLSPYLTRTGWSVALLGLNNAELAASVAGMWLVHLFFLPLL